MTNHEGIKTSWMTLFINLFLSIIKMIAGVLGQSSAMIADGFHSLSDVFSTILVIIGLKMSGRKADKYHPYGYERWELVFSQFLSIILLLTAAGILWSAIQGILSGELPIPGKLGLYAALISIVIKEIMYQVMMKKAIQLNSLAMKADAWHHRSDALSSIATFIGILGARLGYKILDPIAGILVAIMIGKVGFDIYKKSIEGLVDEAASKEDLAQIKDIALKTPGVFQVSNLKTRQFASKIYIDMDICVDSFSTVIEGHDIATKVHDRIEEEMEEVAHVMVHVEPTLSSGHCQKKGF